MDRATFNETVLSHYKPMYASAYAIMRDSDSAADALQDAMVSLWESRDRLDSVSNLKSYCITAVRRKCLDKLKSFNENQFSPIADTFDCADSTPLQSHSLETRQTLAIVRRHIDTLPDNQKNVLMLSAYRSLSNSEIAEATGLSEQNVRVLLCRARQRLRQLYLQTSDI